MIKYCLSFFLIIIFVEKAQAEDFVGLWNYRTLLGTSESCVTVHPVKDSVYHIEVAKFTSQAPGYERLAVHLAIEEQALIKSLTEKSKKCPEFHPDGYTSAYVQWSKDLLAGTAKICKTSIADCLSGKFE